VLHDLPDDYYPALRREYLEATVEQVSKAAAGHLHPKGMTLVVEGDAAVIRDELTAAAIGEMINAEI
jgi:zinc protease